MLILKIIEEKPKRKHLFKKRKSNEQFLRESFICNNTIFTVAKMSKSYLNSPELSLFLNRYQGAILYCDEIGKNFVNPRYIFDSSPYFKRAFLSALADYMKKTKEGSLFVSDNNFRFSEEWLEIASQSQKIIIDGVLNAELRRFCDYCFSEFGLQVFVNDRSMLDCKFISVDLNSIDSTKNTLRLMRGDCEKVVCADSKYFQENEDVKKLVDYGVDLHTACAAMQVVPFRRIYLRSETAF